MSTNRLRILLFFLGAILVPIGTLVVILFARGYRLDFKKGSLRPAGLLAATSIPDGAQIYINGQLASATNTTINLSVGDYAVEIKKIGFQPWKKQLKLQAELVTQTKAVLFPSVPSLKAVSMSGAKNPIPSPDGSRVLFTRPGKDHSELYILDLSESPLGLLNRDPKLLMPLLEPIPQLAWTANSKQIMITASSSAFFIDTAGKQVTETETQEEQKIYLEQKLELLPSVLRQLLATSAGELVWSPNENKILYTATASAVIPVNLIPPLPGSNSQPETRNLKSQNTYIYDLEEDRNFAVGYPLEKVQWFPDSNHIVITLKNKVLVTEYDGTNSTTVYEGPMEENFAYPYPSGKQILILTNLTQIPNQTPNLYAVSLR